MSVVRLAPHLKAAVTLLLVINMALPVLAQDIERQVTDSVPDTQSSQTPEPSAPTEPSTKAADPCADLREQVQKIQAEKKLKKKKAHHRSASRKKQPAKNAKKSASGKHATSASRKKTGKGKNANGTTACNGAISMKDVRDILGTTRDFSGRNLNCLDLTGFDLKKVNFSGASMIQTNCSRANLEDSNLERTNLTDANLTRSNLHLSRLAATTFSNAKLDGALWIDRRPCAPGSIGACRDTFQQLPPR